MGNVELESLLDCATLLHTDNDMLQADLLYQNHSYLFLEAMMESKRTIDTENTN